MIIIEIHPHKIRFCYEDQVMELQSEIEGDECNVCFNGKWFRTRDDFFKDAEVDGYKITSVYNDLYGFEVIE